MSWKQVSISSVSEVVTKGTTPTSIGFNFVKEGIPFLRVNNIQNGKLVINDILFIDSKTDEALARSRIQPKDILISIAGTIGRTAVVPPDAPAMNCNQAVAIIRLREGIDPYYINYWLSTDDAVQQITGAKVTATISNLSLGCIKELKIPLPPLQEQRRIATILDKADAIRRKRQQAIALTEELLRSAFLEMFGDPVTNPKGWEVHQLKDFSEIQSGIAKGKKIDLSKAVSIPYMRVANVQDGYLDLSEIKTLEILPTDIDRYILREGDLLLTEGGDPDKLGRGAVWYGKIQPCIHQNHIFCVRPNRTLAEPEYLSALIGSERGKRYFLQAAKQTTGIATINKTQLCGFPAFLPPLYLQQKYSQFVKLIRSTQRRLDDKYEQTNKLFNSLLQRAFSGEL